MTGRVPAQRYEPIPDEILSGVGISSGRSWLPMGHLANWCNGSGAQLVPGCVIDRTLASGTTGVLHFRAKTRQVAIERIWTLVLRSATAGCSATIKAPTSTGTALVAPVLGTRDGALPIVYREILTAQASAVADLTIEIAATGGDIEIASVTCNELARPLLDGGVDTETERPRERIFSNGNVSATGIVGASLEDIRRIGLYQWSVPVGQPITTIGAYTNILSLGVPVLAPKLEEGATAATVYWSAYAKVSSGSGDVRLITSHSATTDSVNITATSFAWTTPRAIIIDCESMTSADGLQASTFDDLMPSFRANGGVTCSLAAISVWNEAF